MELTPSQVRAQVGSIVKFTCTYKSMETLKVTFLDNGMPVLWEEWEVLERPTSYNFKVIDCYEHRIQCVIETPHGTVVGSVTSLVNPGSNCLQNRSRLE